jgi:hypothetical protein
MDAQEIIAGYADEVPSTVWEALEAAREFLEERNRRPSFRISTIGTGRMEDFGTLVDVDDDIPFGELLDEGPVTPTIQTNSTNSSPSWQWPARQTPP